MYLVKYFFQHVVNFWSCKHPAFWLAVRDDSTEQWVDEDFTRVTHNLYCQKCQKPVTVKYMKCNGGVDAFMARGQDSIGNK